MKINMDMSTLLNNLRGEYTVIIECIACIVLTHNKRLRFSNRMYGYTCMGFLTVMMALQFIPLGKYYSNYFQMEMARAISTGAAFIMAFKLLPMFAFITLTVKEKFFSHVFIFSAAFILAELVGAVTWTVYNVIGAVWNPGNQGMDVLTTIIIIAICYLAVFEGYKKSNPADQKFSEVITDRSSALAAFIVAYLCFIIGNVWGVLFWSLESTELTKLFYMKQFLLITIYLAGVLIVYLLAKQSYEAKMAEEMRATTAMLNLRYQQYVDFVNSSEYLARQCHDLKHQIAGMRRLPGAENWGEYLDELEGSVKKYEIWNVSGNSVLDSLLTQKKQYCIEHDIQLTCRADGKAFDFMPVRDICSIFGNILDNAVEAVSQLEEHDDRVITGEVRAKNNFLLIRFENRCKKEIHMEGGVLPNTSKDAKQGHGYGLKSIKATVEKYDGTMKIEARDGWFAVKIMIPMK